MSNRKIGEQEFYKWIGKRVRELRERAGLKQKELAEKSGVNAPFISKVENFGKKISAFQLNQLLKAMGYSQADLIDDEGKKTLHHPGEWRACQPDQWGKAGLSGENQALIQSHLLPVSPH